MGQELTGPGLGQPHEVFNLKVVIQFGPFLRIKGRRFLALNEIPYAVARLLGGLESNDLAGAERGDELNNFFVRSHRASFALASRSCKPLLTIQRTLR